MEGFKNVNLGNVVSSSKKSGNQTNFVSKEDHEILKVWNIKSYEVKVRYFPIRSQNCAVLPLVGRHPVVTKIIVLEDRPKMYLIMRNDFTSELHSAAICSTCGFGTPLNNADLDHIRLPFTSSPAMARGNCS